jgi:hypothetical protein
VLCLFALALLGGSGNAGKCPSALAGGTTATPCPLFPPHRRQSGWHLIHESCHVCYRLLYLGGSQRGTLGNAPTGAQPKSRYWRPWQFAARCLTASSASFPQNPKPTCCASLQFAPPRGASRRPPRIAPRNRCRPAARPSSSSRGASRRRPQSKLQAQEILAQGRSLDAGAPRAALRGRVDATPQADKVFL